MTAHILIADDDDLVLDLIRFKLQRRGYHVTTTSHGDDVLSALRAGAVDLLILDYQLGGTNSSEIIDQIHKDPQLADVPVIVLSSAWREQDVLSALERGVNDFMTKPFSPDELMLRIQLALRKRIGT